MPNDIDPRAIDDLARSGLSTTDMRVQGMPGQWGTGSTPPSPGYIIPYFLPDGTVHPKMHRIRYYDAKLTGKRYKQPSREELDGQPNPPYFAPPEVCNYKLPAPYVLVVEGEKKAVAAIKYLGIPSVGIGGCWNWSEGRSDEDKLNFPAGIHKPSKPLLEFITDRQRVEFVFDSDVMEKKDVSQAASAAWWMFRAAGVDMRIVVLPKGSHGLDDWLLTLPEGSARTAFEALPRVEGWELPYQRPSEVFHCLGISFSPKTGLPNETNERVLREFMGKHPRYAGRLWVDMVKHRCMVDDAPFAEVNTFDWLCGLQEFFPKLSNAVNYQAMVSEAWRRQRNPITEWLATLKWDGTPRLEAFAERYLGLPLTPYMQRVFINFLVAAVARMHKPGTKFDHMLVLQGPQGIGKTRLLLGLFGADYAAIAPHTTAIGSRDWLDAAGTGWCLILDELAGLSRVEHTELKTALSTESDTYRRAYRRDPETFPRMFVLAGTTNEGAYLTDPTGNRRYWPVPLKRVNVNKVLAEREQLWAEALHHYRSGFDFWDMPEGAQHEAEDFQEQAHLPDEAEEACERVLARAFADSEHMRPPIGLVRNAPHYFVGTMELMKEVAGEQNAYARNAGLGKRIRSAMTRNRVWEPAKVYVNGVQRRGYALAVETADAVTERTHYKTTWVAEFGEDSKF